MIHKTYTLQVFSTIQIFHPVINLKFSKETMATAQ